MNSKINNVTIIGSGPAGYTAAIYAARAGLNPVLYQGLQPGGQLMITSEVENFPGYPEGVTGPEMMEDFKNQAERFGTEIIFGRVTKADLSKRPFFLEIDGEKEVLTHSVIISTGASAKWLGLESETRLNGRGVSACAVCDGFFFRNQEVIVVGGGDTAAEEATYLSKICKKVHLIVRRNEMRASKIMQERVLNTPNIEVHWNSVTIEILGENGVEGARLLDTEKNTEYTLNVTGFFVAIGHTPNTEIFKGQLTLDDAGYIVTKPGTTQTNIEGVFAAGDAQDKIYRQAVTAAGTGCMAALEAERWLGAQHLH